MKLNFWCRRESKVLQPLVITIHLEMFPLWSIMEYLYLNTVLSVFLFQGVWWYSCAIVFIEYVWNKITPPSPLDLISGKIFSYIHILKKNERIEKLHQQISGSWDLFVLWRVILFRSEVSKVFCKLSNMQ